MFSKNGEALIARALGQFDLLKKTLSAGIEAVNAKMESNWACMKVLETENDSLDALAKKAKSAIAGIDKLLNGN